MQQQGREVNGARQGEVRCSVMIPIFTPSQWCVHDMTQGRRFFFKPAQLDSLFVCQVFNNLYLAFHSFCPHPKQQTLPSHFIAKMLFTNASGKNTGEEREGKLSTRVEKKEKTTKQSKKEEIVAAECTNTGNHNKGL